MQLKDSLINPLYAFLDSLVEHGDDPVTLNSNNLPVIALYFNSGGVICESYDEVHKLLELLAETGIIELTENKLRITQNGKDALKASKRPVRGVQDLQKNGSKPQEEANKGT
jgi:hypothetical protein